jgi:hypothetical protein
MILRFPRGGTRTSALQGKEGSFPATALGYATVHVTKDRDFVTDQPVIQAEVVVMATPNNAGGLVREWF